MDGIAVTITVVTHHMSQEKYNYLRTHRRRFGFTQDEIAFLLGGSCGSKVARYERRLRRPNLKTAFACQIIFDVAAHEIFSGSYQLVGDQVAQRAHDLLKRLEGSAHGVNGSCAKCGLLERIVQDRSGKRN